MGIMECPARVTTVLAAVLTVILASVTGSSINSYAGPFTVVFRDVGQCPEGTVPPGQMLTNLTGNLHYSRPLKGTVFDGQFVTSREARAGDYAVKMRLAKWDTVAGWRNNFFLIEGGEVCSAIVKYAQEIIGEIHRNNPKFPTTCPIPKGVYTFRNLSTGLLQRFEHFPVFPYGRFKGNVLFYEMKSKDIVGCFQGSFDVVPKVNKS
ncbi:LexA repressor [Frankliniella fusca]|uniref:LexA repressor n=1 Tax=Frankliniella fusca TaxID=407009 RepID=A0AAE1GQ70_9NEOP|nr:LexA repressor [Frankliniella fusca]